MNRRGDREERDGAGDRERGKEGGRGAPGDQPF